MRFFTIAGFALYWLDIRLFDHRTPSASLSPVLCSRLRTLKMLSFFSMAIWRRNVIVSLIAIVTLMAGLALNIRSTLPIPTLLHDDISLMSFHPRSNDGEHVVPLQRVTHFNSTCLQRWIHHMTQFWRHVLRCIRAEGLSIPSAYWPWT